ncbi:MAG: helix-turn-helix domain-containing protein [Gammaproteobacteria bacterium]|nr:helix-turn-helix domain-containing protein [Gammaproteobacteria bacterium]
MSMPEPVASVVVAVVVFDQISPFHLAVPCVVFGDRHPGLPAFDLRVCAVTPGSLMTTAGFRVEIRHGLEALAAADMIIVPSWRDPAEAAPPALLEALRTAARRGARIVGLCLGACVLAEAGLLDGRRATTHWGYAQDFAMRYPSVQLDANVLYVDEGQIVTSAGTAAGIDCCLHLLRQGYGVEQANAVARRLVVPPHRQGGQAQFIDQPLPVSMRSSRLGEVIDWLRSHLDEAHTLDALAARALMSRRTFTRQFRLQTGATVGDWLLAERLAYSQRLLETTDQPIERIAQQVGLGAPSSLRAHFQRSFGVSPSQWRRSFKGG